MSNGHLLFESIFERKLSADDTRAYLETIAEEYPYFSPAQFFLLLKTAPGMPGYGQLAARTNVLFNNAYWLQFQLQEERDTLEQPQKLIDEPLAQNESLAIAGEDQADDSNDTKSDLDVAPAISTVPVIIEEIPAVQDLPAITVSEEKNIDSALLPAVPVAADRVPEIADIEEVTEVAPAQVEGSAYTDDTLLSPAGTEELPVEKTGAGAEESQDNEESHDDDIAPVEDENEAAETPQPVHFNNQSTPLVNETEKEDEISAEQATVPLHFKLNLETPATTEDTITFEPLYTSDYFASQGIKLGNDIKPNDKLGKQLKSFTEWLKTMKKVHNDQLPPLSGQADQSIQKLAEQSNKEDAVVTEAMADVLLKQGKAAKAIEVYKKLSLLDPSKSTYFAAKIDQLKDH